MKRFPIRPIRSDKDLKSAIIVVDNLLDKGDLDSDYLYVLGLLIRDYETKNHSMEPISDSEMLKHLIQARGITQAALAKETEIPPSVISEVINGKRQLSRNNIRKLSNYFNISSDAFY